MRTTNKTIIERLSNLRCAMRKAKVNAYIVPTEDPHLSEYPARHWSARKWISGFTGSAGTFVITDDQAGLWTDSRYFLQAQNQLEGTGIVLYKAGLPSTPSIPQFLSNTLTKGLSLGFDGNTYSYTKAQELEQQMKQKGILVNSSLQLIDEIWINRPPLPFDKAFEMPSVITGLTVQEKITKINHLNHQVNADATILSALDDVAWTFNLRGTDVNYNPVVIAYGFISDQENILFIHPKKLTTEIIEQLKKENVTLADYDSFYPYLSKLPHTIKLAIDPNRTNTAIVNALPKGCKIIPTISPANQLKSIKNETEIKGFRSAVLKDGIATTKFYYWLEKALEQGEKVTELSASKKLSSFRAEQPGYLMDSFETISSYGAHGAIVHYAPTPESDIPLGKDSLYLVDSGGQYLDGTTDITRTIALCENPSAQMKEDYTCTLKGTIALASCQFPEGTRGSQIDSFARQALWNAGINYRHGTGHGIGHVLNVHEGPQSIRMEENPVILEPGMVLSDEPAMYREGAYGIRTENMILLKETQHTAWGKFMGFETLTLCYIDTKLINLDQITPQERAWLNRYHKQVYEQLATHLNKEERTWLANKTKSI